MTTTGLGAIQIPDIPAFDTDEELLNWLRVRRDELESDNAELRLENELYKHQLYGKKSEKVKAADDAAGQQRLFDDPVADDDTGPDVSDADDQADQRKRKRKRGQAKKRTHARKPVNRELARIERVHGAQPQRFAADGTPLVITGYDVRERLHLIPEQVVCLVDKYAIWGEGDTRETIETTPVLPSIIPGGKLTDDFLIEIARRKYLLSLPLYRQLRDFNALGAELAVSTMCDGIRALANFLQPIHDAIRTTVLQQPLIHIDETTMRQQCDEHGTVLRYLWAWHAGRQVSFHYGTRAAKNIRDMLGAQPPPPDPMPTRHALTDGYPAYDQPLAEAGLIHAGCWAHIRRDFKALADASAHAREVFADITELYRCEKAIAKYIAKHRLTGNDADAYRLQIRTQRAQPTIDRIATLVERYQPHYRASGPIGAAFTKLHNQFTKLRVYAATGHVPIDNNAVERDMRQVAIGRKNYLFVGSEDAGSWCATMYSLIESARLTNIDVRAYLTRAVSGLHADEDPAMLTPAALKKELPKAKITV